MPPALSLRPVAPADREFLFEVYASTRAEELAVVPWSPADKDAFLRMQFEAQDRDYRANYPAESFHLILDDGAPAGRLYLERTPTELHLIDIALLPAFRGRGRGTALLRDLLAEARAAQLPIRLYVEHLNPARRLYFRFGFTDVEEHGPYWQMKWTPPPHTPTTP
ncbi:MAG TPA: GNAT family N-acetyltransferase [Opitutaceae bacterium]|nr:GNAT family N-acetyltransferase [Opitutaceae bacterium]